MATTEAVVLPTSVRPAKYQLKLQPDFANFTFQGEETIDIRVAESTSEIVLNCDEIQIQSAELIKDGSTHAGWKHDCLGGCHSSVPG